jgi:hypothetical protein
MRALRWIAALVGSLVVGVLLLYAVGGMLFDGPLGPIPGGALQGPVSDMPPADWSGVEKVIELEIRPDKPWSLSIWAAAVDGELYALSKFGARRPWPAAALEDPRVRIRTNGKIYERRFEKIDDPALRARLAIVFAERYGGEPAPPEDDPTWYFRLAPPQ